MHATGRADPSGMRRGGDSGTGNQTANGPATQLFGGLAGSRLLEENRHARTGVKDPHHLPRGSRFGQHRPPAIGGYETAYLLTELHSLVAVFR